MDPLSSAALAALLAVTTSPLLRPLNNHIALVGHSMQAQALAVTTSPHTVYLSQTAVPFWLSYLSKGRYQFRQANAFGVSGSSIKDLYRTPISGSDTQLTLASKCAASTIYIHTGHNDFAAGLSWQQAVYGTGDDGKGLSFVIKQLVAAGKTVAVATDIPSGDATYTTKRYTATQLAAALGFRDWVLRTMSGQFAGQAFGIDYWPVAVDPASATAGDVKLLNTKDFVHPATVLAYAMAMQALPVFDRLGIPQAFPAIGMPGDAYSAANNQRGNLLTNGILVVASAMPANSGATTCSGVRPAGWAFSLNAAAAAATLTITGSQVTNARGQWFQMVISGTTAANAGPQIQLLQTNIAVPSAGGSLLAAGVVLEPFGEMEIDAGGTGLYGAGRTVQRADPAGNDTIQIGQADSSLLKADAMLANLVSAPLAGTLAGGLFATLTGTETSITPRIDVNIVESATINLTIRVKNLALRKLLAT